MLTRRARAAVHAAHTVLAIASILTPHRPPPRAAAPADLVAPRAAVARPARGDTTPRVASTPIHPAAVAARSTR